MALTLKTRTDVEDLAVGCTFFGTGGGGSKEGGLAMLYPHIDAGKNIELVDTDFVEDDDWVACPAYAGTIAPPTPDKNREAIRNRFPWKLHKKELAVGLEILEKHMGVKFKAVAPFELGGLNTLAPIDAGIQHGIPCVDGDYTGRAVPEISQNTVCTKGYAMAPMAIVDWYGNKAVVDHVINYEMGERISRALSEAAWGRVGNVAFPIQGKDYKKVIIPGTLTKSHEVGKTIRECRTSGEDPADRIAENLDGWVLFKGEVIGREWEIKGGYLQGNTTIKGSGLKGGSELKVWFKNENLMTWLDGEPWVMSPDLLAIIDQKSGEPITNSKVEKGSQVSVIGLKPMHPMFREPDGLAALGPGHFGFDVEYKKIEDVVG